MHKMALLTWHKTILSWGTQDQPQGGCAGAHHVCRSYADAAVVADGGSRRVVAEGKPRLVGADWQPRPDVAGLRPVAQHLPAAGEQPAAHPAPSPLLALWDLTPAAPPAERTARTHKSGVAPITNIRSQGGCTLTSYCATPSIHQPT